MTPEQEILQVLTNNNGSVAYQVLYDTVTDATRRRLLDYIRALEANKEAYRQVAPVDGKPTLTIYAGARN